ncbi:membrane-bound lytic murein transglycosylase D [Desulfocicer vacuolatum DSM 3385]|uniref:Membrane-bound lytic murein transglycosylase D n=1 Tax=Desulfocicer vacuolatum DSM 3385 TaxID=1121400 RepID=A0A1W1YJ94_9BACT|nr:lytic transglycosylase domain-containing protein [Desulfocicer vacuolatum]SMC36204.1 membrane-bound lytic murein transglycosylase D [Desulfocicer vacuolatum DSM 3385]
MNKNNIGTGLKIVSLIGIFYLTGCTHTMNTASTSPPTQPPASTLSGLQPSTVHQRFLKDFSQNETIENEGPCEKTSSTDNAPLPVSATDKSIPMAQEGIDHALELCESAQDFWEKGELESALNELDIAYATILDLDLRNQPELNQQKEDLRYMIAKRILEIHASRHIVVTGEHNAIPLTLNTHVKKEIARFTGPEKQFFIRSMKRAGRYRPYILAELKKAGLPQELSWLPLIESGFKVKALSHARALGLWQFIPSTGYKFGLKRNYFIDERLDPEKATQAAIAYLSELHNIFGDWATVLAAYNCGEGRVLKTIRRQKTNYLDNFWDLYEKLPRETARYVPRFLATLHILKNPEKYNIDPGKIDTPIPYEVFTVKKQVYLKNIASATGASLNSLKSLNPELRYELLPADPYELRIPQTAAHGFLARFKTIKPSRTRTTEKKYVYHRVKRGQTLSSIARYYGTTLKTVTSANGLSTRSVIRTGKVLKIPANKVKKRTAPAKKKKNRRASVRYTVRSGDNLWLIANKYGTTTKRIQAANKLRSTRLYAGQKLIIPGSSSSKTKKRKKTVSYRVKSGDNPFTIAQKYNMTLQRLLSLNRLTSKSRIYPGQKLLVE